MSSADDVHIGSVEILDEHTVHIIEPNSSENHDIADNNNHAAPVAEKPKRSKSQTTRIRFDESQELPKSRKTDDDIEKYYSGDENNAVDQQEAPQTPQPINYYDDEHFGEPCWEFDWVKRRFYKLADFIDSMYGPFSRPNCPKSPVAAIKLGWHEVTSNLKAAITVALINIPLSISLALAAGGVPVMGIITAVWSGVAYAIFGGSSFNIMGPSGSLMGILLAGVMQYGVNILPYVAIISGLLSILVYLLRLDKYFIVPTAATTGFAMGVAVIIALGQLQYILGIDMRGAPKSSEFYMGVIQVLLNIEKTNIYSLLLFFLSTAAIFFMVFYTPSVPAPVVISAAGVLFGVLVDVGVVPHWQIHTIASRFGEVQTTIVRMVPPPLENIGIDFIGVISVSASVTFVSMLETLISAKIAANMTNTTMNPAKETLGLGVANIITGIFGGVPTSAALSRTALNIRTGATSKFSGFLNSVLVGVIALTALFIFQYLLLPFVAAILMLVAYRTVDVNLIIHLYKNDKRMFVVACIICVVTVMISPAGGIVFGQIISLLLYAYKNSKGHGDIVIRKKKSKIVSSRSTQSFDEQLRKRVMSADNLNAITGGENTSAVVEDTLVYKIPSELTYVNCTAHLDRLKRITDFTHAVLNLKHLHVIDLDGIGVLNEMMKFLDDKTKGNTTIVIREEIRKDLMAQDWFKEKDRKNKVFYSAKQAVIHFHTLADSADAEEEADAEQEEASQPAENNV